MLQHQKWNSFNDWLNTKSHTTEKKITSWKSYYRKITRRKFITPKSIQLVPSVLTTRVTKSNVIASNFIYQRTVVVTYHNTHCQITGSHVVLLFQWTKVIMNVITPKIIKLIDIHTHYSHNHYSESHSTESFRIER